ncbi:hypothetical protein JCM8097_007673 [Rhodosporidiobolus ruineniae]
MLAPLTTPRSPSKPAPVDLVPSLQPPSVPAWRKMAATKRAEQASLLPTPFRLSPSTLSNLPDDVRGVPAVCGLLSARQLEITEVDEASTLLERLREGAYSAVEVAEAFCGRAAIAHQLVNCLTEICFESALKRARELDEHLQRTGKVVGPLHGLPVSLKDQFCLKGVDSTMGFVSLIGKPAAQNSVVVDLLLELGAVLYCKTNCPQTMMAAETNNNVFGRTLNPRDRKLAAGGSSGGEGALLAMKGSIVGVGTDYGGSIRVPSLCNGLYGLRPTTRRLPYAGVANVLKGFEGIESTIGPMARSVDSLRVFMDAVVDAEPCLRDSKVIERPWLPSSDASKLHVAYLTDSGLAHSHPPVRRAIAETVAALRAAGHEVTELPGLDFARAGELFSTISAADGGADLASFLAGTDEPIIPEAFAASGPPSPSSVYNLSQTLVRRDAFRQDFLETWRTSASSSAENRPFDLILCPLTAHLAWPHLGRPHDSELITWTTTWSLLDVPCATLPVGELDPVKDAPHPLPEQAYSAFDQQHWDGYSFERFKNAPLVVQLVSPRRFREDELLGMVSEVERAVKAYQAERE